MLKYPISQEKEDALEKVMASLGIRESDLEEQFIRSQGPGGQNVNKVSSCVILVHKLTGIQIRCERERSQSLNRFFARRLLVEKIQRDLHNIRTAKERERYQKRKQKKRRSRRIKQKLRELKEHRKEIKGTRNPVKSDL